jgi:hypothetical protein
MASGFAMIELGNLGPRQQRLHKTSAEIEMSNTLPLNVVGANRVLAAEINTLITY